MSEPATTGRTMREYLEALDAPHAGTFDRASAPGVTLGTGVVSLDDLVPSPVDGASALAPPAPDAHTAHAFFTEIDAPLRPSSEQGLRVGLALSHAERPEYDAATPATEAERAASPRATRFSWDATTPETPSEDATPRFSWEAPPPGNAVARFSWEVARSAPPPPPRFSWEPEAPALMPRGSLPPGPLTNPLAIDLPAILAEDPAQAEVDAAGPRRPRLALRVHVCRDAFRLLVEVGVSGEERRVAERGLATLGAALDSTHSGDAEGPLREPDRHVATLSTDELTRLDRLLTELEDKLLELDDRVTPGIFRERIEGKKHSRTLLARYARLLASRRFNAGQRRDRFEWLATRLLTVRNPALELEMIPKNDARAVLQHLIGGMGSKAQTGEASEAVEHLKESLVKLETVRTPEELFESGFFLDVHGYKVSMRDLLVVPDFLYLSAAIGAKIENMLEAWIAHLERTEPSRVVVAGPARARVHRMLADQEAEVDRIFGVRRVTDAELQAATKPAERPKAAKRDEAAGRRGFQLPAFAWDRTMGTLAVLAVLILGSASSLLVSTGSVAKEKIVALQAQEIERYSSVLQGGWIFGTGEDRHMQARISTIRWKALDKDARWAAAEELARTLEADGILEAQVLDNTTPIILIQKGKVTEMAP